MAKFDEGLAFYAQMLLRLRNLHNEANLLSNRIEAITMTVTRSQTSGLSTSSQSPSSEIKVIPTSKTFLSLDTLPPASQFVSPSLCSATKPITDLTSASGLTPNSVLPSIPNKLLSSDPTPQDYTTGKF
ncbi:unnamed protein product [Protopolystoma xenopodis]|uniref:Uncharacterized protein n=1 Tax=Protopolystoma xenopodis TaxID=117903 RepID=A0A3S5BI40_9PLAT|nr:unnamed protein product [Protopolystoma xenopodis]